jgi:class 3 adenylate cyclase
MASLPQPVVDYLCDVAIEEAAPAFVRVDQDGTVVAAGGRLDRFGLDDGLIGAPAESRLDALVGLLPAVGDPLVLPAVEVAPEVYADVHVFGDGHGSWVVLVDKSDWAAERRVAQQLANDMSLLRAELGKQGRGTGGLRWEERYSVAASGARVSASVLTAVVHQLATIGDTRPAEVAIRTAGLYTRALATTIVDEAGVVHAVCGQRLTAIFGVLPTTASAPNLAVTAALRGMAAVDEVNDAREREGDARLPLSVGIATGEVAFGALGGHVHRLLGVVGACVERSSTIAHAASEGHLAIDVATFTALEEHRSSFRPWNEVYGATDEEGLYVMVQR